MSTAISHSSYSRQSGTGETDWIHSFMARVTSLRVYRNYCRPDYNTPYNVLFDKSYQFAHQTSIWQLYIERNRDSCVTSILLKKQKRLQAQNCLRSRYVGAAKIPRWSIVSHTYGVTDGDPRASRMYPAGVTASEK